MRYFHLQQYKCIFFGLLSIVFWFKLSRLAITFFCWCSFCLNLVFFYFSNERKIVYLFFFNFLHGCLINHM